MDLFIEGIKHITDFSGYDHLLFLLALIAPYQFKDWKKWLLLISIFTIGHSISLILSSLGVLKLPSDIVEFLIPVTILITAVYNAFLRKKSRVKVVEIIVTLIFSLIHGFGFSGYFKMIVHDNNFTQDMISFNLGIEIGQIIIVLVALMLGRLSQLIPGVTQWYWTYTLNFLAIVLSARLIWEKWIF